MKCSVSWYADPPKVFLNTSFQNSGYYYSALTASSLLGRPPTRFSDDHKILSAGFCWRSAVSLCFLSMRDIKEISILCLLRSHYWSKRTECGDAMNCPRMHCFKCRTTHCTGCQSITRIALILAHSRLLCLKFLLEYACSKRCSHEHMV